MQTIYHRWQGIKDFFVGGAPAYTVDDAASRAFATLPIHSRGELRALGKIQELRCHIINQDGNLRGDTTW
jgi:hypothetical protein